MFNIFLDVRVGKALTNDTFNIENCVLWVHTRLVLGCVTNQTLVLRKRNPGRSRVLTHVVRYYVHASVLEHAHT